MKKFADSKNEDNNLIFSEDVKMSLTTKDDILIYSYKLELPQSKQVEKEMLYYDKSVDRYEDYQQEHTKNKSQHSPRL